MQEVNMSNEKNKSKLRDSSQLYIAIDDSGHFVVVKDYDEETNEATNIATGRREEFQMGRFDSLEKLKLTYNGDEN